MFSFMESMESRKRGNRMNEKQPNRKEFEQWAAKEGLRMARRSDGKYVAPFTAIAWRAWQAAKGENNDI